MQDYGKHLEFVRQARELGAVKITVGEVVVEFAHPPVEIEPADPLADPALEAGREQAEDAQRLAEWRQLQYHSSGG